MSLSLDKSTWKRVRLGDVIRRSRIQVDPVSSGVERYVAGGHIDSEGVTIERWGQVGDGQMGSTFRYVFQPGQVLFVSARPYLRKVGVPDFSGVVADKTYVLDALPENGLLQEFLPFVLSSEAFVEYATAEATGSMNPRLLWGPMQRYEFNLPPLDEQKRIADLVWVIERHRRAIPLGKLALVEGRMLECLLNAKAGKSTRIDGFGTVLMGRQRSPRHATGDHMVRYLRVANIGDDELRLSDVKQMNFSPDEQERYSVLPNDILLSEGQSRELVGQSALVASLPEKMCFQNTLIRFRPNLDVIRPAYAQALFRACLYSGKFADLATRTTSIAHLGASRFAQLQVRVPEIPVQDRFLVQLERVRAAIDAAKAEANSLLHLWVSLDQSIFGGDA